MKRLIEYTVFSGLVTDWRLATVPTSRSPFLVKATTDGVVRPPSWFGMTTAWPPSMTDTTELVVPKSIPMILLILPSIFRLRIRLVLACDHYQTLVCYCQVEMSLRYFFSSYPRHPSRHASACGFPDKPSKP